MVSPLVYSIISIVLLTSGMVKAEAPNTYWSKRSQGVGLRTFQQDPTQLDKERRMNSLRWKEAIRLDKFYRVLRVLNQEHFNKIPLNLTKKAA